MIVLYQYSLIVASLVWTCAALQIPFLSSQPPNPFADDGISISAPPRRSSTDSFTLRHALHASTRDRNKPILHRPYSTSDVMLLEELDGESHTQSLSSQMTSAWRPSSNLAYQAARRSAYAVKKTARRGILPTWSDLQDQLLAQTLEWHEHDINMPNITDVGTINALAKMASNAYTKEDSASWWDLDGKWNVSDSFGWLENGIRGHVFANNDNSTIVVALKGTSAAFIGGGGSTSRNDKFNDNLLFSCCCARVDWSWSTVCDCYAGPYTCQEDCLEDAVMTKSAYYPAATDLYNNISALYPTSQIWLTGHSLGGAMASLLSRTYGVPAVTYETPGELLPSRRLHLPLPPPPSNFSRGHSLGPELATHVYHNADPIPQGACTGAISSCAIAGFALESRCHAGQKIVYDTVGRLGWSVDIRTHSIKPIIDTLFVEEWGVSPEDKKKQQQIRKVALSAEGKRRQKRRWGWWPLPGGGKKDGDQDDDDDDKNGDDGSKEPDDGQHGGRGVPDAVPEDDDCFDCFRWKYE